MLVIRDIHFAIGGRPLFEGASATIPTGHKVGVVGPNGSGKTTLFRLIRGELPLEAGEIEVPRGARIGGVAQEAPASDDSLLDTVLAADPELAALTAEERTATDPARIAEIHTRLAEIDAQTAPARASAILRGLGFSHDQQARPSKEFSGGWRMRVALAGVLFADPDVLLLDEPTNYLDLEGALWLESYLKKLRGTVLIISHDRSLLNRAVGGILHLGGRRLTYFTGSYDQFARAKAERDRLADAQARKIEAQRKHMQAFVDRFRYKASKAKQAQSRLKMIERLGQVARAAPAASVQFNFPRPEEVPPPLAVMDGVAVGYDGRPVLKGLRLRIDQDDRIALLGANGEGKSTLAKLLSGRLAPLDGALRLARGVTVGYFAQHQIEELEPDDTPLAHVARLRPDEEPRLHRARLAGFGLGEAVADLPVGQLSGGQKARLSLLIATIDAPAMLILDEPTNHLDMDSRAALADALNAYTGAVILVSHDLELLNLTCERLWLVRDGRVTEYTDDLETYRAALLAERGAARTTPDKPLKPKGSAADRRRAIAPLQAEVSKCEARITKLEEMTAEIERRLADPALYARADEAEIARLSAKRAEAATAMQRAEALWEAALEALEEARAQ